MRTLLTFDCEGALLGATLDEAEGGIGLVMAMGGSQARIGSHRMYERLSNSLKPHGVTSLRFDRRGVGDSEGEDPGFRGSAADLRAAAAELRRRCPGLRQIYGFGLCDGATALALFAGEMGLDGLMLANPWLVEAEAGDPPAAAVRRHYRERLLSLEGWRRLLTGSVDIRKLARGVAKIATRRGPTSLAADVAAALARHRIPAHFILATGDATAIAAEAELKSSLFNSLIAGIQTVDSDSHTFARPGDEALLTAAVVEATTRLAG